MEGLIKKEQRECNICKTVFYHFLVDGGRDLSVCHECIKKEKPRALSFWIYNISLTLFALIFYVIFSEGDFLMKKFTLEPDSSEMEWRKWISDKIRGKLETQKKVYTVTGFIIFCFFLLLLLLGIFLIQRWRIRNWEKKHSRVSAYDTVKK